MLEASPAQIEILPIADLKPVDSNPRYHSESNVAKIAQSIQTYGWTTPVLIDAQNEVIAGHGRLLAADTLGLTEVPCIRLAHLTPELIKAYRIADNRLALDSEWDDELLTAALKELSEQPGLDLSITGFNPDELAEILGTNGQAGGLRQLDEQELDSMDEAWLQCCHDWSAWVALVQDNGIPISPEVTKGVLAVRYLRSLFFREPFPSSVTLSFTPHRFFTNANNHPISTIFTTGLKKRSMRDAMQWACRDEPKFSQFVVGTVPLQSHRMPGEFPADLARDLIDEFCPPDGSVLDPCHGWGGRAVGFLLSNAICYEGFDPDPQTCRGVEEMIAFLAHLTPWRAKASILHNSCFEDSELHPELYDFAITSPPYYDVEKYGGEQSSWRRYKDFDAWVDGFYRPLIAKVEAAIKPGSTFALQVGSQAYPLVEIGRTIASENGLSFGGVRHTEMVNNRTDTDPDEGEVVMILHKKK